MRRREWILVAFLAALPRLAWPDLVSFTADEGIHVELALSVANLDVRNIPVMGLPSVGIRNSPLFMHLLGVASLPIRHPLAGLALVAAFNVALVTLTFQFVRERFGRRAAWLTALFFITAPWQVLYARNMWPPSCVGMLAFLVHYRIVQWLEGRREPLGLVLPTALAQVVPQMHFSGFVVPAWVALVSVGVASTAGWRRGPAFIGAWFLGLVLGTATWSHWIHWQHASNEWADFPVVQRLLFPRIDSAPPSPATTAGKATTEPARAASKAEEENAAGAERNAAGADRPASALSAICVSIRHLGLLSTGEDFRFWFGVAPATMPDLFPAWHVALVRLAAIAALGITLIGLTRLIRGHARDRGLAYVTLVWLILPIALLAILKPRLVPHYVLIAWPTPAILFGVGADWLAGSRRVLPPPLPFLDQTGSRQAEPASRSIEPGSVAATLRLGLVLATVALISLIHLLELDGWRRYLALGRHQGGGHFQHSYRHRAQVARSLLDRYGNALDAYPGGYFSGQNPAYRPPLRYEGDRRERRLRGEGAAYVAWLIEPGDLRDPEAIARNLRTYRGLLVDEPEARWMVGPTEVLVYRVRR